MYVLVIAISSKVPMSKDFTYTIKCSCQTKLKRFNFKNRERGQLNTKVQISPSMTEMDIKRLLVEIFPFLENAR